MAHAMGQQGPSGVVGVVDTPQALMIQALLQKRLGKLETLHKESLVKEVGDQQEAGASAQILQGQIDTMREQKFYSSEGDRKVFFGTS